MKQLIARCFGLILFAGAFAPSAVSQITATDTLSPLPEAERLQLIRDRSVVLAPSVYRSALPILLHALPVNPDKIPTERYVNLTSPTWEWDKPAPKPLSSFEKMALGWQIDCQTMRTLMLDNPSLARRARGDLRAHRIEAKIVQIAPTELALVPAAPKIQQTDPIRGLKKFLLPRKYWKPGWESVIQLSQTYISPNWHKGGNSNLNLYNKQIFKLDYQRDDVSWKNSLEWRLSIFSSNADTVSRYRVADDLLRLSSNIGIKAYKSLFYSLDAEVRTQLFTMREENKRDALSTLLSPIVVNVGLGMRYLVDWKSEQYYGRRFRLDLNVAPLAYDFRWTARSDIALTRHGFKPGKRLYRAFGSMLKAEAIFDITQSIAWKSRLFYNTSYSRVEAEWENSLSYSLSKYFSTRVNVLMRFDDGVPRQTEWRSRLQLYQLLSLGLEWNI